MKKKKSLQTSTLNIKKFSFFYNLFIYISLLVILIIVVSSTIGNQLHSKQLNENISESNEKMLALTSYNFKFMHESVEAFLIRLSNDVKVKQLINTKKRPETAVDIFRLMEVMTSYKQNLEFIQSFYLYNGSSETFYVIGNNNTIRYREDMFDLDIVSIVDGDMDHTTGIQVIPRKIPSTSYDSKNMVNVYTYVFSKINASSGELEQIYIVNVLADWFLDSINSMSDHNLTKNSHLLVYQYDGTVMAYSGEDRLAESIKDELYYTEILQLRDNQGTISLEMENKDYIVSYNRLESEGIILISITEKDQLYSEIRILNTLTIIIMIGLVIIGLLTSYILSKVIYKPISNLKSNLALMFDTKEDDLHQGNEFQLIQSLFEDVQHNLLSLKSFKKSNIDSLKEQFIVNMFKKRIVKLSEVEEQCKSLELNVNVKNRMQLIFFTIDNYKSLEQLANYQDIAKKIHEAIRGRLYILYDAEVIHMKHYYAALINIPLGHAISQNDEDSKALLELIQANVKELSDYSVTITVSTTIRSVSELYDTYHKLKLLAQSRLTKGHESIIFNEIKEENFSDDFELPVEDMKKMMTYLKSQETDKCCEKCHKIIENLKEQDISKVRLAVTFMTLSMIDTINVIKSNARVFLDLDFTHLQTYVSSLETLDDIEGFYCETMKDVIAQVVDNTKNRSYELVSQIKEYISNNYSDYSMTPNVIASSFSLTLKYANTLFKKDTGLSIASYINDYRLEKAGELLVTTRSSVDHILDLIGWENQSYFFTLFKKKFGVTPTIYRVNK